jgi:hypothetical protein
MSVGTQETKYSTDEEGKRVMQVVEVVEETILTKADDAEEIIRNTISGRADLKEETIEDLTTLIMEGLEAISLFDEEKESKDKSK